MEERRALALPNARPPPPMLDHGCWVLFGYEPFDQSMRLPREREPAVDASTPSTDSAQKVLGQRNSAKSPQTFQCRSPQNMTDSCDL